MRRIAFAALACLAVAWTAPPAAASSAAHVTLAGPDAWDAPDGRATVPVTVALVLEEFACPEPARFPVEVTATAHGATAENLTVWFDVPEGSYMMEPFVAEANATLNVTVTETQAVLVLNATFAGDGDPCIAPGGFPEAQDGHEVLLHGPPPPEPDPPGETNETDANETPSDDETPSEQPPDANETEPATGGDGGSGATGDLPPAYRYVGEGGDGAPEESRGVPGPGAAVAVAAAGAAAMALRRRAG